MSGPSSPLKFSHAENPNDPGALSKALAEVKIGDLKSFGGRSQNSSMEANIFSRFTIHAPPDITGKTRIVAVLGIQTSDARPDVDGWLLSDFMAFFHLCVKSPSTKRGSIV